MPTLARVFFLLLFCAPAVAIAETYVPDALNDWQQWVLKDREYLTCPFFFDRSAARPDEFVCAWPGRMRLDVAAANGAFDQSWTVYGKAQWLPLPGSTAYWPDRVTANDRPAEVILRNGVPSVRLAPGAWRLRGRFDWDQRPGVLALPQEIALLALTVDGRAVQRPEIDRNGVYLGVRERDERVEDAVRATVHRLVIDEVPTRLATRLRIDVSGSVREELFGPLLPDGFVPLHLESPLPARLEADGRLRLQVRPGTWVVHLAARAPAVMDEIRRPVATENLPETEIWSFQANDRLRVAVAESRSPIDPAQADVPGPWLNYPAFRFAADDRLQLVERSRGVVSASNELQLTRSMWLDFDGDGYVVEDRVGGTMRTGWRLDMAAPYTLLTAAEDDDSLLVTQGADGRTGVELRRSDVALRALGRSAERGRMPVTGWDARFTSVQATLNLPPGHKLLMAPGVDAARGSWAGNWQLLDFFLLLIVTIAAWRLFNPAAGVIALLALVLSYHELMAPTWLWLNALIAIALVRVAPAGKLRSVVQGYRALSAAVLVVALVPFLASQLRIALYPQLEPQYNQYGLVDRGRAELLQTEQPMPAATSEPAELREVGRDRPVAADAAEEMAMRPSIAALAPAKFARYAPNAVVQAGPGIPAWRWNSHALHWSGPVEPGQSMRLVVLGRWAVTALRFVEVALILLFAALLAAEIAGRRWTLPGGFQLGRSPAAGLLAAGIGLTLLASPADAQLPDAELLRELENRLVEAPDCVPRCAEIATADVVVRAETISMQLGVHAMEAVAVPLPGSAKGWQADAVLVDGATGARVLRGRGDTLWLHVDPGRHVVTLRGAAPVADSLELPFPAPPRVITVDSDGWQVAGIRDRRLLSGSLQLSRRRVDSGDTGLRWESSRFPAFATIERRISLDLDWTITTSVTRIAPTQGAITLDVPLVDGESIVSGDFTVSDGRVLVSMSPQQNVVTWTSTLPLQSPLTLAMGEGASWKETWAFLVGNVWHADFQGIPRSNTPDRLSGVRIVEFDPRAGEQLTVNAFRPEAAAGSTLAFDAVRLAVVHGGRSSDVTLSLDYRSTRSAQHIVSLPDGAEVSAVTIDGRAQTLRAEGRDLTLPIVPGSHEVVVTWRSIGEMGLVTRTPEVDLGAPASNIRLAFTRPRDRWLLGTAGPELGPAVLYWSELAVLVLFAWILGRIGLAPLTTRHWLLLGLGFSTFSWPVFGLVALWLLSVGAREKWRPAVADAWFNPAQVATAALTVAALLAIVVMLPRGLLGTPDMHVVGQETRGTVLGWFADASDSLLPVASVVTVPLWVYKVLILAWALWLSFALLRWLPWVWQCFSRDGLWRGRRTKDDTVV